MDDGRGAQLPHTARTLCTPCALRGHACRLTCLHVVPMRRRVRAAGRPGEQKCSPGDCRPVRPGAACCIATHGAPWEVRALGPWHGLESVGIGLRGVIFFAKMRVRAWKWHCFLWLAPKRRSQKSFLCTHRVRCAGVLRVSWPVFALCTHRSQGARGKPAWRAKVISGSFAFRKSRRERLKAYGLRAARL